MYQRLRELSEKVRAANLEKGFGMPDSTDVAFMLIITELAEAVEADRKDRHADCEAFREACKKSRVLNGDPSYDGNISSDTAFAAKFEAYIKDTVEDEIADVVIRCLDCLNGYALIGAVSGSYVEAEVRNDFVTVGTYPLAATAYFLTGKITNIPKSRYEKLETADALYYVGTFLFTWCKNRGVDLLEHIKLKMRYNASRPHKHGKKY